MNENLVYQGNPCNSLLTNNKIMSSKLQDCIIMVGLPARGKSYIAKMLCRYLNWRGNESRIFNAGDARREHLTSNQTRHDFFDSENTANFNLREQIAMDSLRNMVDWCKANPKRVGIFDATNSTTERRDKIRSICSESRLLPFFVESICDKEEVIERNIRKIKLIGRDYIGVDQNAAFEDFLLRIEQYKKVYVKISGRELESTSFAKICDAGKFFYFNKVLGVLQPKLIYYLININLEPRKIYITRHGESVFNRQNKIGGESALTSDGVGYARMLGHFFNGLHGQLAHMAVWLSPAERAIQTAKYLCFKRVLWRELQDIRAGIFDSMTYEEIKSRDPEHFEKRRRNKFFYQYPRGESYKDLIDRLEPLILQIESVKDVAVICHQAVSRALLAYFCDVKQEKIPYINVPLNQLFELTPANFGYKLVMYSFDVATDSVRRVELDELEILSSDS